MDLLHLEINSKNITSMKSCQQFISSSGVTQSLASKLQHLQTHSHHSLTTCLCYGLWLAASSQTGDTHLTALSTIPAPAFGASVFLLIDIVFSSHRNLRLHCCKSPSLSLVLTFNIPSALFTPSSLPHLSHLFLIYSFFLHRSHPSHCCIMALERNLQCFPIIHVCPQDSLGSFKKKNNREERRASSCNLLYWDCIGLIFFFLIIIFLLSLSDSYKPHINIIFIAHLANPIGPQDDPCLGFPSHFSMVKLHTFQLAPSLFCLLHPPRGTITRKQCPSASALGQNKLHFYLCWKAEWGTRGAPTAASLLLLPPASCSASTQPGWLCHGHCSWQLRHTDTCSHV